MAQSSQKLRFEPRSPYNELPRLQAILINSIPLLEARASSEIENIVTTAGRLFRFAQDDDHPQADPATKETLRYRTALRRGFDHLKKRPLSTSTAVEVCRMITGTAIGIRRVPTTSSRRSTHSETGTEERAAS
jgi:Fic family protein